ncbi:MAG: acyl-CoA thioesterase [Candidatus Latescibacteria bacterium]|nr:acyl-CoA thioesterase [Candidatus Latescibacterota bacterium]
MSSRNRIENGRLDPGPVRPGEYVGRVPIQVRYAETDAQAVVYHSNFLIYFEVGRTEWMKESGIPYTVLEEQGYALFVAECHIRYLRPASYDDELTIETRLAELRTRSCTFSYRVLREGENDPLVEGWTSLVCTGGDRRAAPLPDELAEAMRKIADL